MADQPTCNELFCVFCDSFNLQLPNSPILIATPSFVMLNVLLLTLFYLNAQSCSLILPLNSTVSLIMMACCISRAKNQFKNLTILKIACFIIYLKNVSSDISIIIIFYFKLLLRIKSVYILSEALI